MNVAACLVTRGDVRLHPILDSLTDAGIEEIVVWDNNQREDLAVYGRYAVIAETEAPLVFVQDDDVVLPTESIEEIIWQSDSGGSAYGQLVCNMPHAFRWQPQYVDGSNALVGFGACFHRDLPAAAFSQLPKEWLTEPHFYRTCDVVFTSLTPHVLVDLPYRNLPWANAPDRMWMQPAHIPERNAMRDAVKALSA